MPPLDPGVVELVSVAVAVVVPVGSVVVDVSVVVPLVAVSVVEVVADGDVDTLAPPAASSSVSSPAQATSARLAANATQTLPSGRLERRRSGGKGGTRDSRLDLAEGTLMVLTGGSLLNGRVCGVMQVVPDETLGDAHQLVAVSGCSVTHCASMRRIFPPS